MLELFLFVVTESQVDRPRHIIKGDKFQIYDIIETKKQLPLEQSFEKY